MEEGPEGMTRIDWMHECLKLLRCQWSTASEFAEEMGMNKQQASADLAEMLAQGMVASRIRSSGATRASGQMSGINPVEFTLSRVWGGQG